MHPIAIRLSLALTTLAPALAQEGGGAERAPASLSKVAEDARTQLEESLAELAALRESVSAEQVPLSARLNELERALLDVKAEYQDATRLLETRTLDLANLQDVIDDRRAEEAYLLNLFGEYARNFDVRIHVAERGRYGAVLEAAQLAPENESLDTAEVYAAQSALLSAALERLHDAAGGTRFEGSAADPSGLLERGTFVLIGPAAIFRSADGTHVGTAEERLGSREPAQIEFADPLDAELAAALVSKAEGSFPLDPSLGNAHKIAATKESFAEHVQKGGPVMVPIFVMAGAALLVALLKWLSLAFNGNPSRKRVAALLEAVGRRDRSAAVERSRNMHGPIGGMLRAGVQHLDEPKELIEEVMYENVLTAKHRLQSFLPFIAICAASAPLLGLLGTVTGIINTFKLITVFGSGDVKTLSGGISEALITTKFGLVVAIPSLLLHAFLSRKARGITARMESTAMTFLNEVAKSAPAVRASEPRGRREPDAELVRAEVNKILGELLTPITAEHGDEAHARVRTAEAR